MKITKLQKALGLYKTNTVYTVKFADIKPNPEFKIIGKEKYKRKWAYYNKHKEFESQIVLRKSDWQLIDGYSSFVIARILKLEEVPVIFR